MELDHRLLCNCLELASGWMFACERESCDFSMYSDDRVSEAKVDLAPVAARMHEEGGGADPGAARARPPQPADVPHQPSCFLSLSFSLSRSWIFLPL